MKKIYFLYYLYICTILCKNILFLDEKILVEVHREEDETDAEDEVSILFQLILISFKILLFLDVDC